MDKMTESNHVGKRIYGVIKQWNQTCADYAEMGADVLELVAHPDTDMSQAMQALGLYRDASVRIRKMRSELETRYPDYDFKI